MTKKELQKKVTEVSGVHKKDVEHVVNVVFDILTDALTEGEKVSIDKFGTFSIKTLPERKGINPKTLEAIVIPERKKVVFKAAKGLRDALR